MAGARGRRYATPPIAPFAPTNPFQAGFAVDPCTLEVGDYILTPDVCVERKSLSDLVGSLGSGRLYKQAEQMVRHYKQPMLLIEFSDEQPFELAPDAPVSLEVDIRDVRCKLVLLLIFFPTLRVLWARNAHATVNLFRMLKAGAEEPDRETAAGISFEDEDDGADADGAGAAGAGVTAFSAALHREGNNTVAIDLLRKLPGVTTANSRVIMEKVPSLAALAALSVKEIAALVGAANAALLHGFLHREVHAGE